jgi:PEP-CTERM motif
MDQTINNATRLITFDLGGTLSTAVSEAWIEIRIRELSGFSNDALILENNSARSIGNLEVLVNNGADKTLLYNLSTSELLLLSDGLFSVALQDDHAIDWIGLGWSTVPEPSSLTLFGLGGLSMIKRRRRDHVL